MSTLSGKVQQIDSIKTDIVNCHSLLKNKLISREITVYQSDKMLDLINKIEGIKGRWAGGEFQSTQIVTSGNMQFLQISNLTFKPSTILIIPSSNTINSAKATIIYNKKMYENEFIEHAHTNTDKCVVGKYSLQGNSSYINQTGFKIRLFCHYSGLTYVDLTHHWYAFE